MLSKFLATTALGAALIAAPALAQNKMSPAPSAPSTTKSTPAPAPSANKSSEASSNAQSASASGLWQGSKLIGLNVYNQQNENIGSIKQLMVDKDGTIKSVVIGVGGFLGMGEHLVAVSFDKVKFSDQPVAYTGASNAPASGTTHPAGTAPPTSTTTTGSTATTSSTTSSTASSRPNPWYPDHAMFNATKDELKAMPEFKYSE
jgi:hypothetical protein